MPPTRGTCLPPGFGLALPQVLWALGETEVVEGKALSLPFQLKMKLGKIVKTETKSALWSLSEN